MAIETKKYLDAAGVTTLWGKIQTELNKKGQVNSVSAANNSVTVGGTASAPTVAVKLSTKDGNQLVLDATSGKEGLYVAAPAAAAVYSITKLSTPTTGMAATYQLAVDGVAGGTKIDIPKDMVVSGGTVKTVTTANSPYTGAAVGDKYIEITLANAANDKLYIPANALVEYVTSGSTNGDMVVVSVSSDHKVTATITDGTVTKAKLASAVQTSLGKADTAVQTVEEGTSNGTIKVDGEAVAVHGLGSAAYTASTAYATSAQGTLAESAVQSVVEGTANGTIKVDGEAVSVHGLGSAAYTASTAYDASGAAATAKSQVIGANTDASSANTIWAAKKFGTEEATAVYNAVTALSTAEIEAAIASA